MQGADFPAVVEVPAVVHIQITLRRLPLHQKHVMAPEFEKRMGTSELHHRIGRYAGETARKTGAKPAQVLSVFSLLIELMESGTRRGGKTDGRSGEAQGPAGPPGECPRACSTDSRDVRAFAYFHATRNGWPTSFAGSAPGFGMYFCGLPSCTATVYTFPSRSTSNWCTPHISPGLNP